MNSIPHKLVQSLATQAGLQLVSVTNVAPIQGAEKPLCYWQESGFAGEMGYMRRSSELLTRPAELLEGARTALVFGVYYSRSPVPELKAGFGRVARYAWGRDYHRVLKRRMSAFAKELDESVSFPIRYRIFSDAVPLLERALAARAGLGFVGKNTMLIRPKEGSYFLLAELLIDAEVVDGALPVVETNCGGCTRCLDSCPTSAFDDPYMLNASRCISYLTIEKRGRLKISERKAIGHWIFGCDVCQEVCPFNHTALKEQRQEELSELGAEAGVGPMLDLKMVLGLRTDEAFLRVFAGTALMRAKRSGLLRNAAVVCANTGAVHLFPALLDAAESDSCTVVREHALWALNELRSRLTPSELRTVERVNNHTRKLNEPDVSAYCSDVENN